MIDIKLIRENPDIVKEALKKRGAKLSLDKFRALDEKKRAVIAEADVLKSERNKVSDEIGKLKKEKKDAKELIAKMKDTSNKIKALDDKIRGFDEKIKELSLDVPNIPDDDVPLGKSAQDNKVVRTWGDKKEFEFKPKPHWDVGEELGILDFKLAAKIAGSSFPFYRGLGAQLEMALINFMLDHARKNSYTQVVPPFMVNTASMTATGQLPKFEEELYKARDDDYYFIPTAEVPLTNIHRDEILNEEELPKYYAAYTPCFRREAGSYGKDTRGLIRNHQFNKIELVKFVAPDKSNEELEKLLLNAENILQELGLAYRVLLLCTGDLGFAAAKTYDLEVWMPGENRFLEISSCGNFTDFQARRANIKYRNKDKKTNFVHTLNGSALAVGRTVAAIIENYQNKDGSITMPEALRPYMNDINIIK
ncbi:MAG: serine--tRNA ligase [bacterium]